jgi:uncharacterized membrane protein YkvA (DUF1232 family)
MSANQSREEQFYYKLRKTIKIWAGGDKSRFSQYANYILAGPDLFMLLVRLAQDERVSQADKVKLGGAVAYFVNPLDLMPEAILGPPGLLDDIALAAFVLHEVLENTDPSAIREHWEGDAAILDLIRGILASADAMVGGPILRRIASRIRSFASG